MKSYDKNLLKKKTLIVMVGLPRAGKSTWSLSTKFPIVAFDSFMSAKNYEDKYEDQRAKDEVIELMKIAIQALFLSGHDYVIVDGTNHTKAHRERWKKWHPGITEFKEFNTPVDVCIQRAIQTRKKYLIPQIKKLAEMFEPLDKTERRTKF